MHVGQRIAETDSHAGRHTDSNRYRSTRCHADIIGHGYGITGIRFSADGARSAEARRARVAPELAGRALGGQLRAGRTGAPERAGLLISA